MYSKILVPVDGSETSMRGLQEALRVAKTMGSTLRLLHVVNDQPAFVGLEIALYAEELLKTFRARGAHILEQAAAAVRGQGVEIETRCIEIAGGPAGEVILEQARDWPADLIVLGTHGRRGLYRLVLGSDAEYVVRGSPVPVLLVRGPKVATGA
jgi:nucleotide-binding universal stress UspA family protein